MRPKSRRLALLGCLIGLLAAATAYGWHWVSDPTLAAFWIHRAEEALAARGCRSSLGTVQASRFPSTLVLGPVQLCQDSAGHPLLIAARLQIHARLRRALRGQLSAGAVQLDEAVLDGPALWARVREAPAVHSSPGGVSAAAVEWDTLTVHDLQLRTGVAGHLQESLREVAWRRQPDGGQVHLEREDGATADIVWRRDPAGVLEGDLTAEAPSGWRWLRAGRWSGHLRTSEGATLGQGTAQASLGVDGAVLAGPGLGEEPLGPWSYRVEGELSWDAAARRWTALHCELSAGPNAQPLVEASAELVGVPEPRASVALAVADVPLGLWVQGLPPELRPPPGVPHLSAPLRAMLRWSGPLLHLERSQLELSLDLELLKTASRQTPWGLRGTFTHVPRVGANPGARSLVVGETNPLFVPLESLPEHVVKAVLVSEDAGFFGHSGFDIEEVRRSLWDPDEKARHRGASTLSQQLAKNLFLDGERTYSRKVREALSTIVLEAALPKARILELYLNIIEWGPDVYGVGEAAQHYFGVSASDLTPKQAAFLASIIPNPSRYHAYFERGELTETWEARVTEVLKKMRDVGALTEEEYQLARVDPLGFRRW